jgi:hypothetical protein
MEYLDYTLTQDPEAVEKHFCQKMATENPVPLSEEITKLLFTLFMAESQDIEKFYQEAVKQTPMIRILEDRVSLTGRALEKDAALFTGLCCQTPGEAVMYAYFISYQMKNAGMGKNLDLRALCENVFPMGMLSRDALERVWDSQKVKRTSGSDNLLDYQEASKSLTYTE